MFGQLKEEFKSTLGSHENFFFLLEGLIHKIFRNGDRNSCVLTLCWPKPSGYDLEGN